MMDNGILCKEHHTIYYVLKAEDKESTLLIEKIIFIKSIV